MRTLSYLLTPHGLQRELVHRGHRTRGLCEELQLVSLWEKLYRGPLHVSHTSHRVGSSECARGGFGGLQAAAGGALRMCVQKASFACAGVPWGLEDIIHPFRIGALSIHILPG